MIRSIVIAALALQLRRVANPWNFTVSPLHFGVGDDPGPALVTVIWPSGLHQEIQLPLIATSYRIVENVADPEPTSRTR